MSELNSPQIAHAPAVQQQIPAAFDAKARQHIPLEVECDGETFVVVHVFDPFDNVDRMVAYYERLQQRLTQSTIKGGVASESDTLAANVWLWDKLAVGMEGRGEPGDELPEDWKALVDDEEKDAAINALLGVQVVPIPAQEADGKRLAWGQKTSYFTVPLRVRFGAYQVETRHRIRKYSAEQFRRYKVATSRAEHVPGSRLDRSDTILATAARELGDLYQELRESVENYVGDEVPLPHRVVVMRQVFGGGLAAPVKK